MHYARPAADGVSFSHCSSLSMVESLCRPAASLMVAWHCFFWIGPLWFWNTPPEYATWARVARRFLSGPPLGPRVLASLTLGSFSLPFAPRDLLLALCCPSASDAVLAFERGLHRCRPLGACPVWTARCHHVGAYFSLLFPRLLVRCRVGRILLARASLARMPTFYFFACVLILKVPVPWHPVPCIAFQVLARVLLPLATLLATFPGKWALKRSLAGRRRLVGAVTLRPPCPGLWLVSRARGARLDIVKLPTHYFNMSAPPLRPL